MTRVIRFQFSRCWLLTKNIENWTLQYDNFGEKFNLDEFNEKFMNVTFNWRNSRPEYVCLKAKILDWMVKKSFLKVI